MQPAGIIQFLKVLSCYDIRELNCAIVEQVTKVFCRRRASYTNLWWPCPSLPETRNYSFSGWYCRIWCGSLKDETKIRLIGEVP